ncbi:aminotransferase class IV [Marinobacter caseinilyticus]|uniref:aminotransferase class IV n=1 Tax=Marinobacter caseinilyticus TaxID=2692195 RepID=UPI00140E93B4|nr:aminotransferase class IV [Marinobacter caseinilyticus]
MDVIWSDGGGIPASDRGLAYGDGLFETIRVRNNQPTLRRRHVQRFLDDARRLGIPLIEADLDRAIDVAMRRYAANADWVLKLILTRGSGGRGYKPPATPRPRLILSAHALPSMPPAKGVSACLSNLQVLVQPQFSGIKSLSRLDQVLASQAIPTRCYESIMTDSRGRLIEGTRTNIMMLYDDQWLVPPQHSVAVAGVMQARLGHWLRSQGNRIAERPIAPSMLTRPECQGLLLMNSVIGVVPVRRLGCVKLPVDARLATITGQSLLME